MLPRGKRSASVSSFVALSICVHARAGAKDICPSGYHICEQAQRPYKAGRDVMSSCCDTAPNCFCDHGCLDYIDKPCILPVDSSRHAEYTQCIAACNAKTKRNSQAKVPSNETLGCYRYCDFQQNSEKSPALAVVVVAFSSLLFGVAAALTSRLLECPKQAALVAGVFTTVAVLVLGLLPASTEHPLVCTEVSWVGGFGIMIYPIAFVGAGGSFFGLAVSYSWLSKRRLGSRHSLGKMAASYFVMVVICNTAGAIGVLHMSCHQEHLTGLPFYIGWIVSSFITNLFLQKIVVMRAALVDKSRLPSLLRGLFWAEVCIALILFIGSIYLSISVSTGEYQETSSQHMGNKDADGRNKTMIKLVAFAIVMISLLFIIFDLMFSCVSVMAMRSGIMKIKEIMVSGGGSAVSKTFSQSNGLLHWTSSLDRAIFFARVNLILVGLSVTTTTLFYLAFTLMTFAWVVDTHEADIERRYAFLFIAWLFDSIFNDICVTFVGFGPTSNALATVGEAAKADIIGAVTEEAAQVPEGGFFVGTLVHDNNAVSLSSAKAAHVDIAKNACD